jgi:hypothetical protein
MTWSREPPSIDPVAIGSLRPTQMTVGMREVEDKRMRWRQHSARKRAQFLGAHPIPVVMGPKDDCFIIDHHHLVLALHLEGVAQVLTTVVADLRQQSRREFWVFLDHKGWVHPYDRAGERCGYQDVPKNIADLVDDPYRSLAGELRFAGGYAKEVTPFNEFLWADFLRRRVKQKLVKQDFAAALHQALRLAKKDEANHLPGWCGRVHGA